MNKLTYILHLEDDHKDAELIQEMLEAADIDCKITLVQAGDAFRAALRKGRFDVILADYQLPGYDGLSALRLAQELCSDIPFIFVSGTMGEDAAIEGLTQGATDYVLKNKISRLTSAVRRALSDAENKRERKHAEETLRESEERYRQLVNLSPEAIGIYNEGGIVFANPATVRMLGAKSEDDLVGRSILDFIPLTLHEAVKEEKILRLDGSSFDAEVTGVPFRYQGNDYIQFVARDITERKQHENERKAILQISNALRAANTRAEMLPILLDQVNDLFHADGAVVTMSQPITGRLLIELGRGAYGEKFTGSTLSPGEGMSGRVIDSGKPYLCNDVKADSTFAIPELFGKANAIACAPLIAHELTIGALWIIRNSDITEGELRLLVGIADIAANAIQRITLYEQTEQQLYRLIALHQIDMTITASLDLGITLNVLLTNVITQLGVDAASILLLTPHTQTLEYAAGTGFRTRNIERSCVRLGVGQAGTAALQRKVIALPDMSRTQDTFSRNLLLSDEKFISHYAAPLIAKGQIKGVLEIFTRRRLEPAQDWLDFFEILATQAAIAIDSAALFNNLQQANAELRLAYDATIEGWSRALDLRDKETEGHTQRVTEMALRLATQMGLSDMEKLNIRRGALLHDIGKMGIPDTILLKPGPLTDEEWQIMRQHPSFALEMLSPIDYLRPALNIPYCHHERWDGNGYPRGLKGEEIPLEARIFSVVDVFDALIVDRPYRLAWPKEKVFAHIQEQSGKAFDPAVVKIFMQTESK